jgi:hypothetical protein
MFYVLFTYGTGSMQVEFPTRQAYEDNADSAKFIRDTMSIVNAYRAEHDVGVEDPRVRAWLTSVYERYDTLMDTHGWWLITPDMHAAMESVKNALSELG